MNMFRLVHGTSGFPEQIMHAYGLTPEIVGRYRDHWLEREGEDTLILALYTRNGGGNREDYADELSAMRALKTFVSDADDSFDSTYCTLRFRLSREGMTTWLMEVRNNTPEALSLTVEEVWEELWHAAEHNPRDMSLIWQAMIATLPAHMSESTTSQEEQ